MFKNIPFLFVTLLLVTNVSLAQKKEKIKGSKLIFMLNDQRLIEELIKIYPYNRPTVLYYHYTIFTQNLEDTPISQVLT